MKTTKALNLLALMALLMPACSTFRNADIRIGDTPAARLAKDVHITGKGVPGQCLPFAMALHKKLEAAGIPSRVIVYGYETSAVPGMSFAGGMSAEMPNRGAHAVVAYDDGGRTYVMDNQSWIPQWVHTAAPLQTAQQFSGINYNVRMARVVGDESLLRNVASSFTGVRIAAEQNDHSP
jgi:hypothetical protein